MSLDPLSDVRYRYRLASEHLTRAEKLFSLGDWAGTVSAAQLSIENFAKAVIALFEVPTWSHDPSNQLHRLINKLPDDIRDMTKGLASMAHEVAPEHGRSSYGEPSAGLAPSDIYIKGHAEDALTTAKGAKETAEKALNRMNVQV